MSHALRQGPDVEAPGLERITLSSDDGVEVAFVPAAGMIGTSMTLDGVELLARRGGLPAYLARGSTFGIPLLAPWANRLADAHQVVGDIAWHVEVGAPGVHADQFGQAILGFMAATSEWEVEDSGASEHSSWLRARLRVDESLDRFASFPFRHDLVVAVSLEGRTLCIRTALTATGDTPVPVAFGWHPWFEFPDVPRSDWVLDVPFEKRALLSDRMIPTGSVVREPARSGPLGAAVLDDVFLDARDGSVASVRAGDRGVSVHYASGYDVAVVFAPAEHDLVCIEPMTAPTDPVSGRWPVRLAAPGETVEAVFEVTVERH